MFLLLALSATFSLASTACTPPAPNLPKRDAQQDSPFGIIYGSGGSAKDMTYDSLPDTPISFGPIDLPAQFLPPPWSPNSNLDSPYPSAIDDGGRSQMVDNEAPIYRRCPNAHLDCRKCPQDVRCKRSQGLKTENGDGGSRPGPPPPPSVIAPEDDGQKNCPMSKCDDKLARCGSNARCTRGFCVCDLGWKSSWRHGKGYRGNEGLGEVTVYNNPFAECDSKCDDLSCKEVEQLAVGVCFRNGNENGWIEETFHSGEATEFDGLEIQSVSSGNVKLPFEEGKSTLRRDYLGGVMNEELKDRVGKAI